MVIGSLQALRDGPRASPRERGKLETHYWYGCIE